LVPVLEGVRKRQKYRHRSALCKLLR